MKLFLHWNVEAKKAELLLFEELVGDQRAIFSSSFHSVPLSRSEEKERPVVETVLDVIERVRAENEILALDRVTFDQLASRCNTFTEQVYTDWKQAGRYDPQLYLPPKPLVESLWEFIASPEPLYMVCGAQGSGKSALVCHWVRQLLGLDAVTRPQSGPYAAFLLEAHRANAYAEPADLLDRCIRDSLQLDPQTDPVEFLRAALRDGPEHASFVFIFEV